MSAGKVLAQVSKLQLLLEQATSQPWWNSHGQPAAGDKSLWDELELLDGNPDLPEPDENGRNWTLLFAGDVEHEPDTDLIVHAVNALPALLELKRAAIGWALALNEIHQKTFTGPGPHYELEAFQKREHDLAELALVVLEGVE